MASNCSNKPHVLGARRWILVAPDYSRLVAYMRSTRFLGLILTGAALVGQVSATLNVSPLKPTIDGVYALAKRQIPQHADAFTFKLVDGEDDTFTISDVHSRQGGFLIECTTVSGCSRGLYTYVLLCLSWSFENIVYRHYDAGTLHNSPM